MAKAKPGNDNTRRYGVLLTRVAGGEDGGAGEVAGGADGPVLLEVAVGRPGAVRDDGVGVVARALLVDGVAVCPCPARVVDGLLQRRLGLICLAHAEICTEENIKVGRFQ